MPREKLITPSCGLLHANDDEIEKAIDSLLDEHKLEHFTMNGKEFVALFKIYSDELSASERIKVFLKFPPAGKPTLLQDIENIERDECIVYDEKQKEAIIKAIDKGILILTGGPGTGKTTALNGILKLFERDGLDVVLAAPTGRAAKRMSEITGKEAKTIHRLLEVEWDKNDNPHFKHNMQDPLKADAVIVDELSMVDITLFSSLLNALPLGCRLIMVGDSDQLPSVGAGNVLGDIIRSDRFNTVRLREIFRQASASLIITNAHCINQGDYPDLDVKDNDFFFIQRDTAEEIASTVCALCTTRLPRAYGEEMRSKIQVIAPSRKGNVGTASLNAQLQRGLNPPMQSKRERKFRDVVFREGDKVMQIKNNYDIEWEKTEITGEVHKGQGVFNGDIGIIEQIRTSEESIVINFDGRITVYPFSDLEEIEHAYAITVHKSQGSEYPVVIIPLYQNSPRLMTRNLLYTAVTRAREMVIIVGQRAEVVQMVQNNRLCHRYTGLCEAIREADKG